MSFAFLILAGLAVGIALAARPLLRTVEPGRRALAGTIAVVGLVPLVFFLTLLAMSEGGPPDGGARLMLLVALALLGLFAWAWLREFTGLMAMGDESFPGRHDKLIWVALMVLLPPVGLAAFRMFRRGYWGVEKKSQHASAADLV